MRVSQLLASTRRESPTNTDLPSHALLERAGYVRQLASGIFNSLNLGHRSLQKIEQILREEMDRIGGVELCMPVVHPAEIWKMTGRYDAIDDSLTRFQDRGERDMVLAMTHEEVVSFLAQQEISSYKQLPKMVYHIQTKWRDELRPRGGLIRVREFVMKDSYSLDVDMEGLQKQYENHYDAYYRIFARMGLPVVSILSDVGMMGGSMAHEYMFVSEIGEDTIFICDECGYKANKEIGKFVKENTQDEPAELEKVLTPDLKTIEDLAVFLEMDKKQLGKVVFFMGIPAGEEEEKLIVAAVRGDLEVNQAKLKNLIKANELRAATPEEITAVGAVPGFASPMDLDRSKLLLVADEIITTGSHYVFGANEVDYHVKNMRYGRDFEADVVGDIVSAYDGAPCIRCSHELKAVRGVEVGNIFQLGTKYSEGLNALFMNINGRTEPIVMGSYGIGVGRALACIAEAYNDEYGLNMPISIAPYHVNLIVIPDNDEVVALADGLYKVLREAGIEVLYDDRPKKVASPGVKFKDADLRGIPIRLTVSRRNIEANGIEMKLRGREEVTFFDPTDAVTAVRKTINILFGEIHQMVREVPSWEKEKHLWG